VLCLLLARAWARQAGAGSGEEAAALAAFSAACEWACAVAPEKRAEV
jgi:hypothetical protein